MEHAVQTTGTTSHYPHAGLAEVSNVEEFLYAGLLIPMTAR